MTDLLTKIKEFLLLNTDIQNVSITPHVELLPLEAGYPAIGIMDGGDVVVQGASQGKRNHLVFISAYSHQVGERENAVLEARSIIETLIPLLENPENFYREAAFDGFNGCSYKKSSKSMPLIYTQHDEQKSYVVLKMADFEFSEIILNHIGGN